MTIKRIFLEKLNRILNPNFNTKFIWLLLTSGIALVGYQKIIQLGSNLEIIKKDLYIKLSLNSGVDSVFIVIGAFMIVSSVVLFTLMQLNNRTNYPTTKLLKQLLSDNPNVVLDEVKTQILKQVIEDVLNDKTSTELVKAIEYGDIHQAIRLLKHDANESQNVMVKKWRKIGALAFFTDTNESTNAFKKVITLDESDLEARLVYSDLLIRIGKHQEVIDLLSVKNTKVEPKIEAMMQRTLGVAYKYLGELDLAEKMYRDGLAIAKSINCTEVEAEILNELGLIFKIKGNYSEAKRNYKNSILLVNESNKNISVAYGNLAVIYKYEHNFLEAEKYYEKALEMDAKYGNKYGCARHNGNLGNLYREQNKFVIAEGYYKESLNLYKELGAKKDIAICSINIGVLHLMKSELSDALDCFNSALSINEEINHKEGVGLAKYNIGAVNLELGNASAALESLESSLSIYEDLGAENTVLELKSAIRAIKI
ncbi:tetratricopeptide repeat protein [Vibrio gigantis]|uniref:tetratricopeptide repeat protein n=1 Tax=Vibrio gigantis TaxID=296199 RepID=UPI003D1016A3